MLHRPNGPKGRLIVALDTPELTRAEALAGLVAPSAGLVKLGLELFCAAGPPALARLASAPASARRMESTTTRATTAYSQKSGLTPSRAVSTPTMTGSMIC